MTTNTTKRQIGYVYFYYGRELVANAPLYSGESCGGPEVVERVISTESMTGIFRGATDIRHKLGICVRVILPRRTLPHPIVYNKG